MRAEVPGCRAAVLVCERLVVKCVKYSRAASEDPSWRRKESEEGLVGRQRCEGRMISVLKCSNRASFRFRTCFPFSRCW